MPNLFWAKTIEIANYYKISFLLELKVMKWLFLKNTGQIIGKTFNIFVFLIVWLCIIL